MESEMRSIGEMARDSGLSVSALRFYDGAGLLVPAWVDPVSGYRWYGPEQLEESRLLARLRRAGMPLADIRLVLAGWSSSDTDLVRKLLQACRRLELELSDARSEFSTLRALLECRENPMTTLRTATVRLAVSAPELAAALDTVRFAASADPELPMLGGVLFDIEGEALHEVATDRYRMAVAQAGTTRYGGPRVQVIVPSPLADAMRALLSDDASVQLTVDGDRVAFVVLGLGSCGAGAGQRGRSEHEGSSMHRGNHPPGRRGHRDKTCPIPRPPEDLPGACLLRRRAQPHFGLCLVERPPARPHPRQSPCPPRPFPCRVTE
ncbi:MerR family transcriptional regulator [Streptomyces sp. NPDC014991]|uniref:DNA polymerase III subunit beta family protein n=1 Tax=Streptomyces sp. NPDC014991 TaxID=3364935 RepID=UPI00370290BA